MQKCLNYTKCSAITNDARSYFNRLSPKQQPNEILVQYYQKYFSFGHKKIFFSDITSGKIVEKCFNVLKL